MSTINKFRIKLINKQRTFGYVNFSIHKFYDKGHGIIIIINDNKFKNINILFSKDRRYAKHINREIEYNNDNFLTTRIQRPYFMMFIKQIIFYKYPKKHILIFKHERYWGEKLLTITKDLKTNNIDIEDYSFTLYPTRKIKERIIYRKINSETGEDCNTYYRKKCGLIINAENNFEFYNNGKLITVFNFEGLPPKCFLSFCL